LRGSSDIRTLAVLPVKSFDLAKQRLAEALRNGSRQILAEAMVSDVLGSLRKVRGVERTVVVTAHPGAEATALAAEAEVLDDQAADGQSAAVAIGIAYAEAHGFDRVLLVPGDTPMLDPAEIDDLLAASPEPPAVTIVPDRHGTGTNALVISPPGAFAPRFGPDSLHRHVAAARDAGLAHRIEEVASLAHDVDTPDDLAALGEALGARRGLAARTRGTLNQIRRLDVPAPPLLDRGLAVARPGR
jgi:2-phospho-L-lactate guanylyltransferase